jgi:type II secretory ATPase GspE/PulE/Tfp pilus assembly ATPase PilB-like protein
MPIQSLRALRSVEKPSQRAGSTEVLYGANFTAKDLALCSSDEARSFLPYSDALELRILPLAVTRDGKSTRLHVAAESNSLEMESRCQYACGVAVLITEVPEALLTEAIGLAYLGSEERLERHVEKLRIVGEIKPAIDIEALEPRGDAAKFLTAILEFAAVRGASDLHLVPRSDGAIIKLRIDGEILAQRQEPYALKFHEQVVSRLKVLAGLDITSRSVPHDGAFSFRVSVTDRSARLSTLPTVHGESVVIRLLGATSVTSVLDLGLEPSTLYLLREIARCPEGLILLTGPTGSGKTTTLYALVHELEGRGRNVVAVEDPVENQIPGIVQVQVNLDVGLDYPRAIRSVLRHDPDVLLIGEIRDALSGSMAVDAATTGHLTLSSLHIGSVFDAVRRLEILGVPPARVVPALRLVLNQRLLPRLCEGCGNAGEGETARNRVDEDGGGGCPVCRGTGYAGQVLATELLDMRDSVAQESILRGMSGGHMTGTLPAGAYIPWSESLQYHLNRGAISISQVEDFFGRGRH